MRACTSVFVRAKRVPEELPVWQSLMQPPAHIKPSWTLHNELERRRQLAVKNPAGYRRVPLCLLRDGGVDFIVLVLAEAGDECHMERMTSESGSLIELMKEEPWVGLLDILARAADLCRRGFVEEKPYVWHTSGLMRRYALLTTCDRC